MARKANGESLIKYNSAQHGFTLVEIAAAIVVLGLMLSAIITLQTRYLDGYYTERNVTRAALYGQYLMTLIEAAGVPPEVGSKDGDLLNALREAGYFDEERDINEDSFEGWSYKQEVISLDLSTATDALRQIDLYISWGESLNESFQLSLYLRTNQQR